MQYVVSICDYIPLHIDIMPIYILMVILFILPFSETFAIPPPDFIIQATTQLWQFIIIGGTLFVSIMSVAHQYLRVKYLQHRKLALYLILLFSISLFILSMVFILYHYFG